MTSYGPTVCGLRGAIVTASDFSVLNVLLEHALSTFDPSVVKFVLGQLPITVPTGVSNPTFDDLAVFPANKPIDILLYLSMPPEYRTAISTVRLANAPGQSDDTIKLIHERKSIAAVFLMNYLLHGTPRQFELTPPKVAKFLLDATGLTIEDFSLPNITSMRTLGGFRATGLVDNCVNILKLASGTFKSRIRKGFGGNRLFSIAKAMRVQQPHTRSTYHEVNFFLLPVHDVYVPYSTFHPDHSLNPMQDSSQRVLYELGVAFKAAGGDVDDLIKQARDLFIPGIVARLKTSAITMTSKLPALPALVIACTAEYSLRFSLQ